MRNLKIQSGFTLIEAVVATSVFAFVVVSSLGVYLATMQLDVKSRAERSVLQNARFIMEFLAKEVRNGYIDYSGENDINTLSLVNQLDQKEIIEWGGATNQNLILNKPGLGTTNLNSSDVLVTDVKFFVSPTRDPFNLANDVHIQPHVTVLLTLSSSNPRIRDVADTTVQSTFTIRYYSSRQ